MSSGFWVWEFRRTWLQGLRVYGVRLQNQFLVSGSRIQILFVLAWAVPILFARQTRPWNLMHPKPLHRTPDTRNSNVPLFQDTY